MLGYFVYSCMLEEHNLHLSVFAEICVIYSNNKNSQNAAYLLLFFSAFSLLCHFNKLTS